MSNTEPGVEFRIMPSGGRDSRWYWEVVIRGRTVVTRGLADTEPEACQKVSDAARKAKGASYRPCNHRRSKAQPAHTKISPAITTTPR